jgi:hypothetical protein
MTGVKLFFRSGRQLQHAKPRNGKLAINTDVHQLSCYNLNQIWNSALGFLPQNRPDSSVFSTLLAVESYATNNSGHGIQKTLL